MIVKSKNPKKPLVLINALSAQHGGGLMIYKALLKGFSAICVKYDILVVTQSDFAFEELKSCSENYSNVTISKIPRWLGRLGVYLQPFVVMCYCKSNGVDVVLSQNLYLVGVSPPQISYHVNTFNFLSNQAIRNPIGRAKQFFRHRSAKKSMKACACVFESHYLADVAIKVVGIEPLNKKVIYIGVDEKYIIDSIPKKKCNPHIVIIGNENLHKRNEMVIDCLKLLISSDLTVDWKVHILGGIREESWDSLIAYAGDTRKNLIFHGYKTRTEIVEVMDESLCLLNPSRFESFCTVALESMARALPCIVTPHTAMPESVGSAGYVATSDTVEEMAGEIRRLWADKEYWASRREESLNWSKTNTWVEAARAFDYEIVHCLDSDVVKTNFRH